MLKVATVVGTRPELIKMSRVIAELDKHLSHVLIHTGQNYDYSLNQVFFDDLGIRKPDYFLNAVSVSDTTASTIGKIIAKSDEVFEVEKPDAVLFYGDTNSCLAVIAAKRRKIAVFHFEAGNRCFDERVPEELNRKVLDHLSDINLVLTEHARRYLESEGVKPETIIKTGSHMIEVLDHHKANIERSNITDKLGLIPDQFFVVSIHREENVDDVAQLTLLLDALNGIAETYSLPVIVSTHPRTRKQLAQLKLIEMHPGIRFCEPFGFHDYIRLQIDSKCVISDSGTITEEASILNLPAITIRNTHERPEGMDVGTLIMSGVTKESVLQAITIVLSHHSRENQVFRRIPDYENGFTSRQILRVIVSYTGYVNRTVWKKNN